MHFARPIWGPETNDLVEESRQGKALVGMYFIA